MRHKDKKISSSNGCSHIGGKYSPISENISRQNVNHLWEEDIFFPLCLILMWFARYFAIKFINGLNYDLLFIFGIGFAFCIKERTIDPILSYGRITNWREIFSHNMSSSPKTRFPPSLRGWHLFCACCFSVSEKGSQRPYFKLFDFLLFEPKIFPKVNLARDKKGKKGSHPLKECGKLNFK